MPDEQNQALYDTLLQIRANPRFQKVAPLLDPGVHEMFNNVLGDQNVPLNKASNPMTKAFSFGRTQDFAPTESNVLGDLTRPGAAIRNSFMHDLTASFTPGAKVGGDGSDNALIQGFTSPRQVPSISSAIPVKPGASEAQLWANAGLGATADMAMEPLNAVPIPGLKALGGGLEALAAKGTPVVSPMMKWFAKETPTMNPGLAAKVATKPGALTGADNVIPEMVTPPTNPLVPPEPVAPPVEAQPQFDFTKGPEVPPTIPEVSTEGAAAPIEQPALNPLQDMPLASQAPVVGLPRDLKGAKPRYNYGSKSFEPQFESDVDKALYITAQKTPSARDADYRSFLKGNGFTDAEINQYGQEIRNSIKKMASTADSGQLNIPASGFKTPKPVENIIQKSASKVEPVVPPVTKQNAFNPLIPDEYDANYVGVKPPQEMIGNLNLVQYPAEQKAQLKTLFAGQEDKLKTKPMTDAQITEKAKELTSLPVTEAIDRSGAGQTAAEIRKRVMTDIAKMKAISEDPALSSQDAMQRILQIGTQKTKNIKTEIGRALGGMRTPLEAQQDQLTAMRKIVDRLRTDPNLKGADSQALIKQLKTQFPEVEKASTPAELFKFMFRNFITSSPRTLLVNATSGYGNVAARPAMRALEVTAAKIRSLMSGNPTSATYKEVGAMLKGMDAALRQGEQLPEALKAKTFSDKYNASPVATLAASAKTKTGQTALDVVNKTVSYPETVMRKTDEHVKNVLGVMEKYAAQARGEDVLGDQHVIDRITSAQARGTFQDEMSSIGRWVAQGRNFFKNQPPTAFNQSMDILTYALQPFIQTVDRIIAKGWNTSVLGAPTTAIKAMAGKYTGALAKGAENKVAGENLDRDIASAMIGIPLFVWAGSQLAAGNITGSAPQDTAGREAFGNSGKTEYSIKVKGRWIPLRDVPEPLSTAIQLNIALIQGMTAAKDKSKDLTEGTFAVVQKVGNMLGTKQYLGGMNSLISSMSSKGADTVNELPLTKKILPSVLVPSAVKDVGVVKDTLAGRPRVMADTAMEAVKRRAGITSGMTPELNTFGEPVTHTMMGQVKDDAAHALAEKFPPQPVERTREGVKLTPQDYHDLKQNVGMQRKAVYMTLANSKAFMDAPKGAQQIIVEDMVAKADQIGSTPQKIKEIVKDPLYYNRRLRVLLEIDKPGGERHFPYLKKS